MNPHCECPMAGWCNRHQMVKHQDLRNLCAGAIEQGDCGRKYWIMWERGMGGATAPSNPILDPAPFCDPNAQTGLPVESCAGCTGRPAPVQPPSWGKYVKNGLQAAIRFIGDGGQVASENEQAERNAICGACPLNIAGNCHGCGCILNLKVQSRLEECPAHKWFPDLHAVRRLENPKRNLIMHCLPVRKNDVWRWNFQQIAKRWELFNGRKCLALAYSENPAVATVTPDEAILYLESLGLKFDAIEAWNNDSNLREVLTFPWLLQQIKSEDPNEVTFSCHAKGVTHSMDSITIRWSEKQYHVCLDDWPTVQRALERFSMAGSFRSFGEFKTPGNNRWHYSGTFYWFRHDDVFTRDWKVIDQQFFGTESWPGRLFKPEETACLFADNPGSPYDQATWDGLQREIEVWEGART